MAPSSPILDGENLDGEGKELSQEEKMRLKVVKLAEKLNRIISRIWQVVACIAILPIVGAIISVIISIVHITQGNPTILISTPLGGIGSLVEIADKFSTSLVIFGLVSTLIPLLFLAYVAVILILRKKANMRVIFASLVVWLAVAVSGSLIHRKVLFVEQETEQIQHPNIEQIDSENSANK
jgi:predicted tellurium resistance membrane protein TerC